MNVEVDKKTGTTRGKGKKKEAKEQAWVDPLEQVVSSRHSEQAEMLKLRFQLDKLRMETMRSIQASRAKFHAARWKMIYKGRDD